MSRLPSRRIPYVFGGRCDEGRLYPSELSDKDLNPGYQRLEDLKQDMDENCT